MLSGPLMSVPITVPKATISMEEANILQWLRTEGAVVAKDESLFEMETDKAVMEVPAPESGTLLRILIAEGSVKPEQVVGWIGVPGETPDTVSGKTAIAAPETVRVAPSSAPPAPTPYRPATPAARRRAGEQGVEL